MARAFFIRYMVCTIGCYYGLMWLYFKIRQRNEKARFVVKALREGLFTPEETIWPK